MGRYLSVFALCLAFLLTACGGSRQESKTADEKPSPEAPAPARQPSPSTAALSVRIETFRNENQSWGYDIYLNGKRYIHQPHQPAVGGKKGFATEAQAQRVAARVVEKINKGIMPPSVTAEEVDSLARGE